jgi:hypothetical protein
MSMKCLCSLLLMYVIKWCIEKYLFLAMIQGLWSRNFVSFMSIFLENTAVKKTQKMINKSVKNTNSFWLNLLMKDKGYCNTDQALHLSLYADCKGFRNLWSQRKGKNMKKTYNNKNNNTSFGAFQMLSVFYVISRCLYICINRRLWDILSQRVF